MPAPGFQHQAVSNPFEESKIRISEYTAEEIALLQHRLEKKLGPEYISARPGPSGQPVHYIGAEKVISLANDVFGFNGWSSSIQNIQVDFVDEHPTTHRVTLGISVVVRVTLRDGTFHEDIGYGQIENAKTKGAAFEKAKKEATTDAMKRALRHFGNVLGNCIYDKDYVKKVTKIKVGPGRQWELSDLQRHGDFKEAQYSGQLGAPVGQQPQQQQQQQPQQQQQQQQQQPQQQHQQHQHQHQIRQQEARPASVAPATADATSNGGISNGAATNYVLKQEKGEPQQSAAEAFDDFLGSMDDFDEADFNVPGEHPDGVVISTGSIDKPMVSDNDRQSAPPNSRPQLQPHGRNTSYSATPTTPIARAPKPPNQFARPNNNNNPPSRPPQYQPNGQSAVPPGGAPETVGFFSARSVKPTSDSHITVDGPAFNPRAESPSIRKTAGIDHSSSKPIARGGVHVPPPPTTGVNPIAGASAGSGGFMPAVNHNMEGARRIGAPGGGPSPLANRGQYRPPTMKRPLPNDASGAGTAGRTALAEVSTNGGSDSGGGGGGGGAGGTLAGATDPKRQKMA